MNGPQPPRFAIPKEEGVAFFKAQNWRSFVGKCWKRKIAKYRETCFTDLVLIMEASDIYVLNESEWVFIKFQNK